VSADRYDISLIRSYLDGKLDNRAMYELERRAEGDPALSDLIRGMESAGEDVHRQNLSRITRRLERRVAGKVRGRIVSWTVWPVAASIVMVFVFGLWWFNRKPDKAPDTLSPAGRTIAGGPPADSRPTLEAPSVSSPTTLSPQVQRKTEPRHLPEEPAAGRHPATARPSAAVSAPVSPQVSEPVGAEIASSGGDAGKRTDLSGAVAAVKSQVMRASSSDVKEAGKNEAGLPSPAAPVGGWPAYRDYLRRNSTITEGDEYVVIMGLTVHPDGAISGIKSVSGTNEALNKRAAALIRNGPKWEGRADGKTEQVRVTVRFGR
jgi:hypothetical protein